MSKGFVCILVVKIEFFVELFKTACFFVAQNVFKFLSCLGKGFCRKLSCGTLKVMDIGYGFGLVIQGFELFQFLWLKNFIPYKRLKKFL